MAARGFGLITGAVGGFVTAGVAASAVGQTLSLKMQQLSLTIGGLFKPEILAVIDAVTRFTGYLQSLDTATKEQIATWIKAAVAGLGVAMVLPRITAGLTLAATAARALGGALLGVQAAGGGLLAVIGGVGAALVGLGAASVVAEDGFTGLLTLGQGAAAPLLGAIEKIGAALLPLRDVAERVFAAAGAAVIAAAGAFASFVEAVAPAVEVVGNLLAPALGLVALALQSIGDLLDSNVGRWVALTAAIAVFATTAIPAAVAGMAALVRGLSAVIAKMITKLALMGPAGWAILVGAGVAAAAATAAMNRDTGARDESERRRQQPGRGDRSALTPRLGGFEDFLATYQRIATVTVQATAGQMTEEQARRRQIELAESSDRTLAEIRDGVRGQRGATVR